MIVITKQNVTPFARETRRTYIPPTDLVEHTFGSPKKNHEHTVGTYNPNIHARTRIREHMGLQCEHNHRVTCSLINKHKNNSHKLSS